MKDFRNIFKRIRKDLGLNQSEFAENLGVTRNTISQIEIGKNTPTTKLLLVIMEKYSYSANDLFTESVNDTKNINNNNVSESLHFNQYYNTLSFLYETLHRNLLMAKEVGITQNIRLQVLLDLIQDHHSLIYKRNKIKSLKESYEDIISEGGNPFDMFRHAIVHLSLCLDAVSSQLYKFQTKEDDISDLTHIEFLELFKK